MVLNTDGYKRASPALRRRRQRAMFPGVSVAARLKGSVMLMEE